MKRFLICLALTFTIMFSGCGSVATTETANPAPPEIFEQTTPCLPDLEEEEEKKKHYAVATVNGLNIRTSPTTESAVFGRLDKFDAVSITGEKNGFYQTVYKEKTAYVSKSYCQVLSVDKSTESVEKAIEVGSSLLGYPYVWGSQRYHWGNGKLNSDFVEGEFDCSALTLYAFYKSNGVILSLTSREQSRNGVEVKKSDLKRGDLMFFTNASRKDKTGIERIGHVGVYFGANYILHTASDHAVIEPISETRWGYYITARRVV